MSLRVLIGDCGIGQLIVPRFSSLQVFFGHLMQVWLVSCGIEAVFPRPKPSGLSFGKNLWEIFLLGFSDQDALSLRLIK